MIDAGHKVSLLTGKLSNADRDAVLQQYRDGKTKVLITTNVLARGIDVPQISMVRLSFFPFFSTCTPTLGHHRWSTTTFPSSWTAPQTSTPTFIASVRVLWHWCRGYLFHLLLLTALQDALVDLARRAWPSA